jgi:hypothetical protein
MDRGKAMLLPSETSNGRLNSSESERISTVIDLLNKYCTRASRQLDLALVVGSHECSNEP